MKRLFAAIICAFTASAFYAQTVTGSGTTNCLPRFTGSSTIGNSAFYSNGTNGTIGSSTDFTFRMNIITGSNNDGLRILQTGASSAALRLDNSYTGGRNWGILSTSNGNSQGGGKILFYDYSGGGLRMLLDGSGNLGIGVNATHSYTPQTRLHIHDGSLKFTGTDPIHGAPNIFWGGTPSSAPDGEWALEYNSNLYGQAGLNFWRPNNSHNGTGGVQSPVNSILFLSNYNRVGINTNNPTASLTVNGNMLIGDPSVVNINTTNSYGLYVQNGILTSKVKVAIVNSANWADYVFMPGYQLSPLDSVKTFVQTNQHLQGVPSSSEVQKDGVDLLQMNIILLQKIEEMTLYMIQQDERIKALEGQQAANH